MEINPDIPKSLRFSAVFQSFGGRFWSMLEGILALSWRHHSRTIEQSRFQDSPKGHLIVDHFLHGFLIICGANLGPTWRPRQFQDAPDTKKNKGSKKE